MSHTSTTITAPVATSDVAAVLAVGSNDVGYLCSNAHGKINRWSKYKPVSLNQLTPVRTGEWWRCSDKRCGLSPVSTSDYTKIPGLYNAVLKQGWLYTPPQGGANSPYRLADFDKYFHAARPPFSDVYCTEKACAGKDFQAGMASNLTGSPGYPTSITLADIKDSIGDATLADYFFGILITDSNGNKKARVTADEAGTNFIRFNLPTSGYTIGQTYKVYPFLSKKKIALLDVNEVADNVFYPLPCVDPVSFEVVSAEEYAGIRIDIYGSHTSKTTAQIEVKVTSTKATNVYGTIYVRHTPVGGQTDMSDVSIAVGSQNSPVSIAANTTVTLPVSTGDRNVILAQEYCGQYQIHAILTIGGVRYEKTGYLLLPAN